MNEKDINVFRTSERKIKFISVGAADSGGLEPTDCRWFYLKCIAEPSFSKLTLERGSRDFAEIEKAGLEFIRGNVKDIRGSYFLSSEHPQYLGPGNGYTLLFQMLSDPASIQIVQYLRIESEKELDNGEIKVCFSLKGIEGEILEGLPTWVPLWSYLENRVLEYLYGKEMIDVGTYVLSEVLSDCLYIAPKS